MLKIFFIFIYRFCHLSKRVCSVCKMQAENLKISDLIKLLVNHNLQVTLTLLNCHLNGMSLAFSRSSAGYSGPSSTSSLSGSISQTKCHGENHNNFTNGDCFISEKQLFRISLLTVSQFWFCEESNFWAPWIYDRDFYANTIQQYFYLKLSLKQFT